jgi:hypothetical protein
MASGILLFLQWLLQWIPFYRQGMMNVSNILCVCVCTHAHSHTNIHTYIHTYIQKKTHTHTHNVKVYLYAFSCANMSVKLTHQYMISVCKWHYVLSRTFSISIQVSKVYAVKCSKLYGNWNSKRGLNLDIHSDNEMKKRSITVLSVLEGMEDLCNLSLQLPTLKCMTTFY